MAQKKKNLTPKQETALMVLAAGQSNEAAAHASGVNSRSVRKWLKDETFQDELRKLMERTRQMYEGRVFALANNAAVIIDRAMRSKDEDRQMEGAKLATTAAVRLATRYKALQMEGFVPPPTPMIVFPEGTTPPWMKKALPVAGEMSNAIEAEIIEKKEDSDSDDGADGG